MLGFTVDSGVPAASTSWQTCVLVVPQLFLTIRTSSLSAEGDGLGFLPDLGEVTTTLTCVLGLIFGICMFLEIDIPGLCKSKHQRFFNISSKNL